MLRRALALAAAVLLLALAAADEPDSTLEAAFSTEGRTQEPEPGSPAKLEASGESDLTTAPQRPGKALTAMSFEGAERSLAAAASREAPSSDSSSLDTLESGSWGAEALRGAAPGGAGGDGAAGSRESQEGADRDLDSEEALEPQGM